MLLPQFSLRTALKLLTASTVLFVIVRQAFLGTAWAVGISFVFLCVPFFFLTYAAFYGLTILMSRLIGVQRLPARTSQGGVQVSPDEHLQPGTEVLDATVAAEGKK